MMGLLLRDAQLSLVNVWDQDPIPAVQRRHLTNRCTCY